MLQAIAQSLCPDVPLLCLYHVCPVLNRRFAGLVNSQSSHHCCVSEITPSSAMTLVHTCLWIL